MKSLITGKVFTAIDIGTTKICIIVCSVNEAHQLEILGMASSTSHGIKKGVVVNISSTLTALKSALEHASAQANIPITTATVGISGGHIQ